MTIVQWSFLRQWRLYYRFTWIDHVLTSADVDNFTVDICIWDDATVWDHTDVSFNPQLF